MWMHLYFPKLLFHHYFILLCLPCYMKHLFSNYHDAIPTQLNSGCGKWKLDFWLLYICWFKNFQCWKFINMRPLCSSFQSIKLCTWVKDLLKLTCVLLTFRLLPHYWCIWEAANLLRITGERDFFHWGHCQVMRHHPKAPVRSFTCFIDTY